ncbi:DUF4189 domain-containing protein [Xylophilus sp. Kf1]|nr:DUF4189 domain-containing protein [Xylophilus sp. Kf1]
MKLMSAMVLLLALCGYSMGAHAEGNCPSGYYPIGGAATAGCAPIPGGGNAGGGSQSSAPNVPEPVWEDRWGAIAFDGPKGILGAAAGLRSEQAAKSAAQTECKSKGGVNCLSEITYVNACTAFTIGDRSYYKGARASLPQVIAEGLKKCNETDKNCETYYSACSMPARIR